MSSQPVSDEDEQLLRMIERRAMEVVALPLAEREAHYALIKDSCRRSAKNLGMSASQAAEFGEKIDEWVRALVGIIKSGGGASGGGA